VPVCAHAQQCGNIRSQRHTLTLASIASCCSSSLACFSRSAWVQQQPMHKNTCTTAQATHTYRRPSRCTHGCTPCGDVLGGIVDAQGWAVEPLLMCVCVYVCARVRVRLRGYVCVRVHVRVCMYVRVCAAVRVHVHGRGRVCVYLQLGSCQLCLCLPLGQLGRLQVCSLLRLRLHLTLIPATG
jgi:hypothetical protein